MHVAVVKETYPGERRVAVVPAVVPLLTKQGIHVKVEAGAGLGCGFTDQQYRERKAEVMDSREALFQAADVVVMVRGLGANSVAGRSDLTLLRPHQVLISMCDPLGNPQAAADLAAEQVTSFALELLPRITRAQSMDVLSSMATIAGYKAVLLAANCLPRMFPMLMTAAGTVTAAKVLVIGAGVAGLQAIATARRLGAIVQAYDVRPAAMEQIESLGGKAVRLDLNTGDSEDAGGYARQLTPEQLDLQRQLLADVVAENDVCITTAAIPGQPSPLLVTAEAVRRMAPGSVIVDLAAERGGNCQLSKPDEVVIENGVTVLGPTNLASEVPAHASQMFARNVATFLTHLSKDGRLELDLKDEITRETLVSKDGQVVNSRIRALLDLPAEIPAVIPPDKPADADDDDAYQLADPGD